MPHVDDTQIHTYLDRALEYAGAGPRATFERHIAECEACAARLDEELKIREDSDALLSIAGDVDVSAPPFDSIRAAAPTPTPWYSSPRVVRRLAWAASIVLAVGLGWSANSLMLSSRNTEGLPAAADMARAVPDPVAEQAVAPRANGAAAPPATPPPAADAPEPTRTVLAGEAERDALAPPDRAPARPLEQQESRLREQLAVAPIPDSANVKVTALDETATSGVASAPTAATLDVARRLEERVDADSLGAVRILTDDSAGEPRRELGGRVTPPPAAFAPATEWQTVTLGDGRAALGGALVAIEGLPIGTVALRPNDTTGALDDAVGQTVRITQLQADGSEIQLFVAVTPRDENRQAPQTRGAGARVADARESEVGIVGRVAMARFGRYQVVGIGGVPADSIAALLGRLTLVPDSN